MVLLIPRDGGIVSKAVAYAPLPRFLFRAPLLPARRAFDAGTHLIDHPLGPAALALASPDLAAAIARGTPAAAALGRYRRRAAFRPTPSGLLAGVGIGTVAARLAVRTGTPTAVGRVAWGRLAALGRALLDVPATRESARLRVAPSVIAGVHTVRWLGPGPGAGHDFVEERAADLDALLVAALDAAAAWTPWPDVRGAISRARENEDGGGDSGDDAGQHAGDDGDVDELIGTLIDDGLLAVDLVPPLIGAPPDLWMRDRLARIPDLDDIAAALDRAIEAARAGDIVEAQAIAAQWPRSAARAQNAAGAAHDGRAAHVPDVDATLVFQPPRAPALPRRAITRAAALAPLVFRLQDALGGPMAERVPGRALTETLDAATEIFGAGAFDVGDLILGDYGTRPAPDEGAPRDPTQALDDDRAPADAGPAPSLVRFFVDRLLDAVRRRQPEVALRSRDLDPLLPDVALPPTAELFLTPCRPRATGAPGTGWLLGLHAPAGASWGRFAFALGDQGAALLDDLRAAERDVRPGETRLDIAYAPSDALADLCVHPPLRDATLALTGWPDVAQPAVPVRAVELCADPTALEPLALRTSNEQPIAPAPLHRVRSTTAPPGPWRVLLGWSLWKQHAPWALHLGPLADLAWTPRISIDGFVVAPASWRIPAALATRGATTRAIAKWRARERVARFVQVGNEDQLLPVDLTASDAARDLTGHARAHEIWPPLGDSPDASGRRFEAVVAIVDDPAPADRARDEAAIAATARAGCVEPPRVRPTIDGDAGTSWQTFKLFGDSDRQDDVLVAVVHPAIVEARAAGEIAGWFFLRYVDGPGRRPHLRVRVDVHARAHEDDGRFARRLDRHLLAAIDAGDVVGLERARYFPEAARFGGAAVLPSVHALFEADSDFACACLAAAADGGLDGELGGDTAGFDPRVVLVVLAFDTLTQALGYDAGARRDMAQRRRAAHADDVTPAFADALAAQFRVVAPALRRLLGGRAHPVLAQAAAHARGSAAAAAGALDAAAHARIVPPLLHLAAVRIAGLDRDVEISAYTFWDRALEGLARHRPR